MYKQKFPALFLLFAVFSSPLLGQSIAEKKASIGKEGTDLAGDLQEKLVYTNDGLRKQDTDLENLYQQVNSLQEQGASDEAFGQLRDQIQKARREKEQLQIEWRASAGQVSQGEDYGIWYQPETTLGQLVIDYAGRDYIYLIPPEIGGLKVSVASGLPIPREAWEEVLQVLLAEKGIGVRQVNPFLKELYFLGEDQSGLSVITSDRNQLDFLPQDQRVAFVLKPPPEQAVTTLHFLGKFVHPSNTSLQLAGGNIFVVSYPSQLRELLKLYDFMAVSPGERQYRLLTFSKIPSTDMAQMLTAVFLREDEAKREKSDLRIRGDDSMGLKVLSLQALSNSLFLVGTRQEVDRAEKIAREIDAQAADAKEKTVFCYTVKHSDPEELAETLEKIYSLLVVSQPLTGEEGQAEETTSQAPAQQPAPQRPERIEPYPITGYYESPLAVQPGRIFPEPRESSSGTGLKNFIVDPKAGMILAVIEKDRECQLRGILRRLDIPKKMVRIEVVLFEKKLNYTQNDGLNLLKVGSTASNTRFSAFSWNDPSATTGLLNFFLRRPKGDLPAFDVAYNFLLSRQDVQINSAPSVTTLNQTPATIAVVEEISLNTGVVQVETNTGTSLADSFTRAQFGTIIKVTPTVHNVEKEEDWDDTFITLETDITFDTTRPGQVPERPDVTRRNVNNIVRVRNGETVVIGGLRSKTLDDSRESLPILGDIPGFGKLFSVNEHSDLGTEMFIFITPTIEFDTYCHLFHNQQSNLSKRPGDSPEFTAKLLEAQREKRQRDYLAGMQQFLEGVGGGSTSR